MGFQVAFGARVGVVKRIFMAQTDANSARHTGVDGMA